MSSFPRPIRRLVMVAPATFLLFSACGDLPESTENARGVLTGAPLVLAMSVLVLVLAGGLLVAVIGADRFFRSRAALEEGEPAEPEEEPEEVVAGIRVGRAAVPRWLYGAYVLIPIFAFAYIFSNIAPPQAAEPEPTPTPSGPCTECTIAASQIKFTMDEIAVPAATEVTVTFDNTDSVIHDFTVWKNDAAAQTPGGDSIATTGTINAGASGDVTFDSDGAGTYYFNCTIHPNAMFGDLVVE